MTQQIWMNVLGKSKSAQVILGLNRYQGHFAHQGTDSFFIVLVAQISELVTHALNTEPRIIQKELVDELHEREIQRRPTYRMVIQKTYLKTKVLT